MLEQERAAQVEMVDQKQEWAEIYGAQKAQYDQQQHEIALLNDENERLLKKLESMDGTQKKGVNTINTASSGELIEATKRLKKRELECQALWDTLKDLKPSVDQGVLKQVLAKRGLDTKAGRKLNIK